MKTHRILALSLCAIASLSSCSKETPDSAKQATASTGKAAAAGTAAAPADQETAFLSAFRKALEAKDKTAMESMMLKDGTPADIMEFFHMMLEVPAGMQVGSVDLVNPTAEEAAKYEKVTEMPDGKNYKMPLIPTKQLVIVMKEGTSGTSKSTLPVAEKDGRLVILMPVPAA